MSKWLCLLIFLSSLFQSCFLSSLSPPHVCLHDERDALLQLKQTHYHVRPNSKSHPLKSWEPNTDCCNWEGITCNGTTGHIVGLDVSNSSLHGSIHFNSTLFHLTHLQALNLSWNHFNNFAPSGFEKLSRLVHLNLSANLLSGQVPSEISQLTNLVSLDLSFNFFWNQIPTEISQLNKLVFLDLSLDMFFFGYDGLLVDPSFVFDFPPPEIPNLKALVQNLSSLTELHLDGVDLSGKENWNWCHHISFALPNLRMLSMRSCSLTGPLDASISNLHFLSELYLDLNYLSSTVPNSLVNLTSLTNLGLFDSGLQGDFPSNVFLFPNLRSINLQNNSELSVHFPEFPRVNNSLQFLNVGYTKFREKLPNSIGNLKFLKQLILCGCNLNGPIPPFLANLSHLISLDLSVNNFNGQIPSIFTGRFPNLEFLMLSHNLLQGPMGSFLASLQSLLELHLSSVNLQLEDSLSINHNGSNFISSQLEVLTMNFCNISKFPDFLRDQNELESLDLSGNRIGGEIPKWIWKRSLSHLDLSNNSLTGLELPLSNHSNLRILYLHSNMIQDCVPIACQTFKHSNGDFVSPILENLMPFLSKIILFSISNNKLTGKIPFSICNVSSLYILELSNNQLSGTIPICFGSINLMALKLGNNKIRGPIPPTFSSDCGLHSLELTKNMLHGQIPRSLANCKELEVLDVGDNKLNGTFPYWLESLPQLSVLVMRSNNFDGPIGQFSHVDSPFPKLHIFDISFNAFTGNLPIKYIINWKAMINDEDNTWKAMMSNGGNSTLTYIGFQGFFGYRDTICIVDKGTYVEMDNILTTFTIIDLSNNRFNGGIPDAMGNLKSLLLLNLSGNSLTGQIPSSLGNLSNLEALDLSRNNLSGKIPIQLTSLTFLAILNLSDNNLIGSIPQGNQFGTFLNDSYEGNIGLCGLPLSKKCGITYGALPPMFTLQQEEDSSCMFDWRFAIAGYCSGLIIGLVIGQQLFWRNNYYFTFAFRNRGSKQRKHHNQRISSR